MEEHLYDVSHASQHGVMGPLRPQNPSSFPPDLHAHHDFIEPHPPSFPHLHTLDSRHQSQRAQESHETTHGNHTNGRPQSHRQGHGDPHIDDSFEDVRLDLSLGYGGHHQAQHSSVVDASRKTIEHSPSSVIEFDRSNGLMVATHPSSAASVFSFKSSEAESWENTCSSSTNCRLAYTQSQLNGDDFDMPSPTTKGHSVFQMRAGTSQGSLFVRDTLPANGSFVASHDEKVFFCKFCDRRFHSSQALGGHQNAHKRERLVARSTPRFGEPPFYCAGLSGMSIQLPYSSNIQQHLAGANGDRSQACPQLVATMCRDGSQVPSLVATARLQSPSLVATVCKDTFQAPLVSIRCNSNFELDCMPRNNVYSMCNRSLDIKAHSLVHKPAVGGPFTPRTGHLKAINAMSTPSQPGLAHHNWSRATIGVQPGVARCFAPGQDHIHHWNMQAAARFQGSMSACSSLPSSTCAHYQDARFLLHKDAPTLLHHHRTPLPTASCARPVGNHSHSLMPCSNSGFLHEVDSSKPVVDLALRL